MRSPLLKAFALAGALVGVLTLAVLLGAWAAVNAWGPQAETEIEPASVARTVVEEDPELDSMVGGVESIRLKEVLGALARDPVTGLRRTEMHYVYTVAGAAGAAEITVRLLEDGAGAWMSRGWTLGSVVESATF